MEKLCSKCRETKPLSEFSKCKTTKDGFQAKCKGCDSSHHREWYNNNKQRNQARVRKCTEKRTAWFIHGVEKTPTS